MNPLEIKEPSPKGGKKKLSLGANPTDSCCDNIPVTRERLAITTESDW